MAKKGVFTIFVTDHFEIPTYIIGNSKLPTPNRKALFHEFLIKLSDVQQFQTDKFMILLFNIVFFIC